MAITTRLIGECPNGNHLQFTLTGDAGTREYEFDISALSQPVTEDDVRTFIRVLIKICKLSRTWAQVRALFTTGVTLG